MRRTGKWAYVDGVMCTTGWELNWSSTVESYQASCVPDASAAAAGNINITGSMSGLGYLPPLPTEDDFAFIGVVSGKTGELLNMAGDILINETTISIPVSGSGPIRWTANFGVQGEIETEEATEHEDPTRTLAPAAKNGKIQIEGTPDSGTYTDVPAVQDITLVFRRGVATYVDAGFTFREAGNLESDISFRIEDDNPVDQTAYAINGTNRIKVFVTPSLFYAIDAFMWRDHTNFRVDRLSNAMVGFNVSGIWTAIRTRTPAALGTIILPNSTVLYPAA